MLHKSHHALGGVGGWHCRLCSPPALQTHLPSLSYHTVNPAQLGWQTKTTNHSAAILSHSLPQAPHVNQAHTDMSLHTHTCQKAQWKSQTCLLIFTKSAPHLALSFFCYQCWNWRMAGGHKGKTSFPASAQRGVWGVCRRGEPHRAKGPPLTQLLNLPHPSPLL